MKKSQLSEIKNLGFKVILAKVSDARMELAKLQLEKDAKDLKLKFKKRKYLAKLLTILRQKQLLEELESESQRAIESKEKK